MRSIDTGAKFYICNSSFVKDTNLTNSTIESLDISYHIYQISNQNSHNIMKGIYTRHHRLLNASLEGSTNNLFYSTIFVRMCSMKFELVLPYMNKRMIEVVYHKRQC